MACEALITSLIPSNPVSSGFHRDLHITNTALDPVRACVDKLPAACQPFALILAVRLTALFSQLLQNAQESHGVAVPTPSVPEDFVEKAALGKGCSLCSPGQHRVLTEPSGQEACVPSSGADSLLI